MCVCAQGSNVLMQLCMIFVFKSGMRKHLAISLNTLHANSCGKNKLKLSLKNKQTKNHHPKNVYFGTVK